MGAPRQNLSDKVVELVSVHVRQCLEAAGLPAGLGGATTPLVFDRESQRDVYLLGYVSGWCEVIQDPESGIDLADKRESIYALVLLSVFGGSSSAMFASMYEQDSLVPVFERGIAQGKEAVKAALVGREPPNYLLMHFRSRSLN